MIEVIEAMNPVEQFFFDWRYTAAAFFSSMSFIWVAVKIWLSMAKSIGDKANLSQRHEFQAGYFDTQELRYDRLLDMITELKKDFCGLENKALNAEIARLKD